MVDRVGGGGRDGEGGAVGIAAILDGGGRNALGLRVCLVHAGMGM